MITKHEHGSCPTTITSFPFSSFILPPLSFLNHAHGSSRPRSRPRFFLSDHDHVLFPNPPRSRSLFHSQVESFSRFVVHLRITWEDRFYDLERSIGCKNGIADRPVGPEAAAEQVGSHTRRH